MSESKQISFERTRLDYCVKLYERELSRQNDLERKAQFYLSFVTLLLGALFLRIDFLTQVGDILTKKQVQLSLLVIIYTVLILAAISLIISLICILGSIWIREYKEPYPKDTVKSIFDTSEGYIEQEDESYFLKIVAINYVVALENHKSNNDKKARSINFCSIALLIAIPSLAVYLFVISYIIIP